MIFNRDSKLDKYFKLKVGSDDQFSCRCVCSGWFSDKVWFSIRRYPLINDALENVDLIIDSRVSNYIHKLV